MDGRKQLQKKRSQKPKPKESQIQSLNHRAARQLKVFNVDRKIPKELSNQMMMVL